LKLQATLNKAEISKFWKNHFYTPVSTKLHPSYHLNSTQPDVAMWQSSTFKIGQPE